MSFVSTTRASYNRPKPSMAHGKRFPVANKKQIKLLTEIANTSLLMTEASTTAAYQLRLTRLLSLISEYRKVAL